MAEATSRLLSSLRGSKVSLCGQTQVRAGVIRPELIGSPLEVKEVDRAKGDEMTKGARVRIVRGEGFGKTGKIVSSSDGLVLLESGGKALVVEVELDDGERFTVPMANIEY